MENTLLIGLSRQTTLLQQLDVIANNIANMDTNGFKADVSMFEEYLSPVARQNEFPGIGNRLSYVRDRGTMIDLSHGPLQQTGNPLDVAIDGNAFLVVQTPDGERYTRNGAMQINANGELVTSEGYQVMGDAGPIVFQATDIGTTINPEGTISVQGSNPALQIIRGRLRLVSFDQPQQLQKDGSSLFSAPAGVQPADGTKSRVIQGALEKSNVKGVVEMTHMIEVSRTYTMIANLLQNEGDLHKNAIQQLADVPTS